MLCERTCIHQFKINSTFESRRQLRKILKGEVIVIFLIHQKMCLRPPVNVGIPDPLAAQAPHKKLEADIFYIDCPPVQIDIAPGHHVPVDDFVEINTHQPGIGAAQNGEGVFRLCQFSQARREGIVILVNPVEIRRVADAAVRNSDGCAQGGTAVLGYQSVNGVCRVNIQRVLLGEHVRLIGIEFLVTPAAVAKYTRHHCLRTTGGHSNPESSTTRPRRHRRKAPTFSAAASIMTPLPAYRAQRCSTHSRRTHLLRYTL